MEIAFLGDSITEGIHGCSFIDILEKNNPNDKFDNYGKGGDTVKSLYKRIRLIEHLKEYDFIFLFIGVNDILGKLSWFYRLIKTISEQPAAKDSKEFLLYYKKIMDFLVSLNTKIVVLPPLFIGEDISNEWNKKVLKMVHSIEKLLEEYSNIKYINIRKDFLNELKDKVISDYIPLSALEMKQDGDKMKKGIAIDDISKERGLYTTIDGVHLNTVGADIIASKVQEYLSAFKKHGKIEFATNNTQ